MRYAPLLFLIVPFLFTGCSFLGGEEEKAFDPSGTWYSIEGAAVGDCCDVNVLLRARDGSLTGNGTVSTPALRIGSYYQYSVDVTGTYTEDRLSLTFRSGMQSGSFRGTVTAGEPWNYVEGVFSGFGERERFRMHHRAAD